MKKIFLSLGTTLLCSTLLQASSDDKIVEFLLKKTAYYYDNKKMKCKESSPLEQLLIIQGIGDRKLYSFGGLQNELGETIFHKNDRNIKLYTMDTFAECRYFEDLEIKHLTNLNPNNYKHIKSYKDKPLDSSSITKDVKTITFRNLEYKVITSPITGKKWLDRNLGATQVCTSSTDKACYGDYYQWGRLSDGHEKASSTITTTHNTDILNIDNKFVNRYKDWTSIDKDGRKRIIQWNKIDGTGVCPVGFRVPTENELVAETVGYTRKNNITKGAVKVINSETAYQNFLKISNSGFRDGLIGSIEEQDSLGGLWTSSVDGTNHAKGLIFSNSNGAGLDSGYRSDAISIRCIEGN
jgi:uncharacterized protein (TIGR02145 family)